MTNNLIFIFSAKFVSMLRLVVTLASWPVKDVKVSFGEIFKRMRNSFVFMITSKYICKYSVTRLKHFLTMMTSSLRYFQMRCIRCEKTKKLPKMSNGRMSKTGIVFLMGFQLICAFN